MFSATLCLLLLVPAAEPPKPKFPLGKETTYVIGPLDKDGYVEYAAALNERFGKGVTPQNNANVLIWKASVRSPGTCFLHRRSSSRPSAWNSRLSAATISAP